MENKRILYGVFAGVLLAGLFGLYQINNLSARVDQLEDNVTSYQSMTGVKDAQIQALENQIETLQSTLSSVSATNENLQDALELSQSNSTSLKNETREMGNTINDLETQIALLDDAVELIGRGEIENLLKAYGELSLELNDLQDDYDALQYQYNLLLAQQ